MEVLCEAQQDFTSWKGTGMSVTEMSHRGKEFLKIYDQTVSDMRELLEIPQNYKLLFMQGGGTLQFSSVPLNLLKAQGASADYVVTGSWGQKAFEECGKYGVANKVCDTKKSNYTYIPSEEEWKLDPNASYIHYCANETIYGVEFKSTPDVKGDIVTDMSSNFCSKPIDVAGHAVIYAGAQKNLGPAGVAIVIAREDVLGKELPICPTYLSYKTHASNDSMYNTPPCFAIYMVGLMAKHLKSKGGLAHWKDWSEKKAQMLYDTIDQSDGYYSCPTDVKCRSNMNIPFRVGKSSEALEKKFLKEAEKLKLVQLSGHRSVGGCRASIYNGMPMEGVQTLADFMKSFMEENPV